MYVVRWHKLVYTKSQAKQETGIGEKKNKGETGGGGGGGWWGQGRQVGEQGGEQGGANLMWR